MQSVSIQLTGDKLPESTPLFGFRFDTNPGGCRIGNLLLHTSLCYGFVNDLFEWCACISFGVKSVSPKQLCALAHLGCTCKVGTS